MDMMDDTGEIRATAFNAECDKYYHMIEVTSMTIEYNQTNILTTFYFEISPTKFIISAKPTWRLLISNIPVLRMIMKCHSTSILR